MTIVSAAILSDRGVLRVSGPDATDFLQGLITNDIHACQSGTAIHAGLLTPQGKILFEFIVTGSDAGYLIDCSAELIEALAKRLALYKLRSQVEITNLTGSLTVAALWPDEDISADQAFPDPRLPLLGKRVIAEANIIQTIMGNANLNTVDLADYHSWRIQLGIAEMGQDYGTGEVYPHEANFDQLNGVHFTKGCYVGQEVVSRMKHKTSIRKRFVPVAFIGKLPPMGTTVLANGKSAGVIGSSSSDRGLALLRLDRIEGAATIAAGDTALTILKPDWADFEVPGATPMEVLI